MTQVEISSVELLQAQSQVGLLKTLLSEQQEKRIALVAAGADSSAVDNVIADIQEDIDEIEAEARKYDYLLNPRPAPQLCGTCNGHRKIDGLSRRPCAACGNSLTNAQPPAGVTHWYILNKDGTIEPKAAPIGEVPE